MRLHTTGLVRNSEHVGLVDALCRDAALALDQRKGRQSVAQQGGSFKVETA